jgi:hypothetical protein
LFKKPSKRSAAEAKEEDPENPIQAKIEKRESTSKKVKNKSLLSFDDEEDDDGGD